MDYTNKHIAIIGCGESGSAAAELLIGKGAQVTILDSAEREALKHRIEYLDSLGVKVRCGKDAESDAAHYDRAVISPGVDPQVPLVQNILQRRIEMIGELELAYELCQCPVVAITGTNGKTTTTGLVASMLQHAGVANLAGGNLGPAFSSLVVKTPELDAAVVEVSSFQLERVKTFKPKISVWLNFSPDHLDRYSSIEEYRSAKLNIFKNQDAEDFAVLNAVDEFPDIAAQKITFSAFQDADFTLDGTNILYHGEPVFDLTKAKLTGVHNAENLMAALAVGKAWGLDFAQMERGLVAYTALPHRNELVAEINGVKFVNDSKATNPSAVEMSLRSLTETAILIAGGKEKGFEFDGLNPLIHTKVKEVILIGEMADRIAKTWRNDACCTKVDSLEEAVMHAFRHADPGETVLFSPGTSSFDMFRSYAHRGDEFRKCVESITHK